MIINRYKSNITDMDKEFYLYRNRKVGGGGKRENSKNLYLNFNCIMSGLIKSKGFYYINSFIDINKLKLNAEVKDKFDFVLNNYINHIFDLLGSGPVRVESKLNRFKEVKYNKFLDINKYKLSLDYLKLVKYIDKDYIPINWYIDFKSGFEFCPNYINNKYKYRNIVGKKYGVDIKVPWELGRMYHLIQMGLTGTYNKEKQVYIVREFKNEVIDFIINNPYKKTVQWSSTMEVSIRAINLLIAFDIMRQIDNKNLLDKKFQIAFYKLIEKHGNYIISNLDCGKHANNHYLSNIAGLIFIASYLESNEITDAWLVYGTQELIKEVDRQFYEDGGNFEGSTSYHRLSSEFVIYSTALILGIIKTDRKKAYYSYNCKLVKKLKTLKMQKYNLNSSDFFPEWYIKKIFSMGIFTRDITNNKGEIVQIGDNDSGRLIKLSPIGDIIPYNLALNKYYNFPKLSYNNVNFKYYFDENIINHTNLLSLVSSLFENKNVLNRYEKLFPLESSFIQMMSKGHKFKLMNYVYKDINFYTMDSNNLNFKYSKTEIFNFKGKVKNLKQNIKFINYPDFGICLFKSNELYLCISIDTTKNTKLTGHSHNDNLSFELMVNNRHIVVDLGAYNYTAFPEIRNKFRSTSLHNTIVISGKEQNNFKGIFGLENKARAYIVNKSKEDDFIKLYEEYEDIKHIREFSILEDKIIINDYCNKEFNIPVNDFIYSNGYGKLVNVDFFRNNIINWRDGN